MTLFIIAKSWVAPILITLIFLYNLIALTTRKHFDIQDRTLVIKRLFITKEYDLTYVTDFKLEYKEHRMGKSIEALYILFEQYGKKKKILLHKDYEHNMKRLMLETVCIMEESFHPGIFLPDNS